MTGVLSDAESALGELTDIDEDALPDVCPSFDSPLVQLATDVGKKAMARMKRERWHVRETAAFSTLRVLHALGDAAERDYIAPKAGAESAERARDFEAIRQELLKAVQRRACLETRPSVRTILKSGHKVAAQVNQVVMTDDTGDDLPLTEQEEMAKEM